MEVLLNNHTHPLKRKIVGRPHHQIVFLSPNDTFTEEWGVMPKGALPWETKWEELKNEEGELIYDKLYLLPLSPMYMPIAPIAPIATVVGDDPQGDSLRSLRL